MLVVISPAKRLDWTPVDTLPTQPEFQQQAATLAAHARQLTLGKLRALMDLSGDLARLNRARFQAFQPAPAAELTKPAILAFAGDTYMGLDAATFGPNAMTYAQDHLRILSGLYGLLRPLDAIQPYRLEMGSRLKTRRGGNLYDYWRDVPAKALNATAQETESEVLINCASQEYFGAVDLKTLKLPVITPQFMEVKDGTPRIVSFFAKKARGAMARFIVENRLRHANDLKNFDTGGYAFDSETSTPDRPVFLRDAVQPGSFSEAS